MDKKSKVLLTILILTTIVSIGITFYKTVIQKDFDVTEEKAGENYLYK